MEKKDVDTMNQNKVKPAAQPQMQLVQVQVPAGHSAGMQFAVNVNGQQYLCAIPQVRIRIV
jgi:hypothetical protein